MSTKPENGVGHSGLLKKRKQPDDDDGDESQGSGDSGPLVPYPVSSRHAVVPLQTFPLKLVKRLETSSESGSDLDEESNSFCKIRPVMLNDDGDDENDEEESNPPSSMDLSLDLRTSVLSYSSLLARFKVSMFDWSMHLWKLIVSLWHHD